MSTRFNYYVMYIAQVDIDLTTKIQRVTYLIIKNLHLKFESYLTKTEVCILSTMFHWQSANVDPDLRQRNPYSIQ